MITHVVLLRAKPNVEPVQIERLRLALERLVGLIPGLNSVTWGANVSPEGKGHGFELGFLMEFATAADRDGYLPHSEHVAVGPLVGAVADDVLVFDLES